MRLSDRVNRLEHENGGHRPAVWLVEPNEAAEEARARYEAAHGPIGERMSVVWISTGVPRAGESYVCA
jgi:hypothetical protein